MLWALKVVVNHLSYGPSKDISEIFNAMFPDSTITKRLAIGCFKLPYVITYGLEPYFVKELLKSVESKFVICFDEAFKEISKKGQTDLSVKYFNSHSSSFILLFVVIVYGLFPN